MLLLSVPGANLMYTLFLIFWPHYEADVRVNGIREICIS